MTVLELLITLVIIAFLAAVGGPPIMKFMNNVDYMTRRSVVTAEMTDPLSVVQKGDIIIFNHGPKVKYIVTKVDQAGFSQYRNPDTSQEEIIWTADIRQQARIIKFGTDDWILAASALLVP